jgi:hypothetical protein
MLGWSQPCPKKETPFVTAVHPFDLQARAELAARGLTALLDPRQAGLMYFLGEWRNRPPRAFHGLWDYGDGSGRQIDALTLVRSMVRADSPAAAPDEGEALLEAWMLRILDKDDGLSWLPQEPWAEPWGKELLLVDPDSGGPFSEISWAQRGTLLGLTSRYLQTGDDRYAAHGRRMVDGLLRIAERDEHGLYYPEGYYRKEGWHFHQPGLHPAIEEYNAAVAVPALRFFEATGHEPALELARGLTEFALYYTPCYLPDGRLRQTVGEVEGHFHTHSNFALAVLKLGIVLKRRELISWARQTYDVLCAWGTDFGWFPEGFGHRHGEVCCFTDMIEIALLLGRHADRAYYADAERFGRNHLLETQFLSLDALRQGIDRLPATDGRPVDAAALTSEGVTESQVGVFASRSTLNDAFHLDATALMQCCNAAGARALYDVWHAAVEETPVDGGSPRLAVHLRFSVETPALRVVGHEPAEGRLDLTATEPSRVAVRLPAGVTQAVVLFDGRGAALNASDGYVGVDLGAGETAQLHYPLPERIAHYEVGRPDRHERATGTWRSETLLRVDPPGRFLPLYERTTDLPPVEPSKPARGPIASL